jgi:acyl-CoA hydrolase
MEIEVIVEIENYRSESDVRERAVDAFFTFVSIDGSGKARPVPMLVVSFDCMLFYIAIRGLNEFFNCSQRENTLEEKRFQSGERRYYKRKQERKEP